MLKEYNLHTYIHIYVFRESMHMYMILMIYLIVKLNFYVSFFSFSQILSIAGLIIIINKIFNILY